MKRISIFFAFVLAVFYSGLQAQVVVSDDSSYTQLSSNALLEVHAAGANKGVLISRLSSAERLSIPTSGLNDESLLVYDKDTKSFWFFDGNQWVEIGVDSRYWKLNGNAGTDPNTHYLGTSDAVDLVFRTGGSNVMRITSAGNVGIGTANPQRKLEIGSGYAIRTPYLDPGNISSTYEFVRFGCDTAYWAGFMHNISSASYGNGDDFTIYTYDNRDIVLRPSGGAQTHILGGYVGIGTTSPAEKLDVNGNVKFSGALMPNGSAGTSGQILTSQGPGQPPVWQTPASIPLYGNNASSVELNSLVYTTNTSSWEDIPGMSLTFVPEHDYFYIFSSLAARLADDQGNAQFGMAMIQVRLLVNGVEVARSATVITDFDDDTNSWYIITSGSVSFSGVRAHVTSGTSTTVKLQWKAVVNWASSPWRIEIDPTSSEVADHCVITVFD